jgi:hypothetical protein
MYKRIFFIPARYLTTGSNTIVCLAMAALWAVCSNPDISIKCKMGDISTGTKVSSKHTQARQKICLNNESLKFSGFRSTVSLKAVLRNRIRRIRIILGLMDPDPLIRSTDQDQDPAADPDSSIIKQKKQEHP